MYPYTLLSVRVCEKENGSSIYFALQAYILEKKIYVAVLQN
jgi:hypothetical protein